MRGYNTLKTHCPAGHEYTPENTRLDKGGKRHCRECERVRLRLHRRARRAQLQEEGAPLCVRRRTRWGPKKARQLAWREHKRRVAAALRPPPKARVHHPERTKGMVERLLQDDPSAKSLSYASQVYRARYRYDDDFRAKELKRRHEQKAGRIDDDGTLTGAVVRRLFAAAVRCPDCRRAMHPRDKSLDHIHPKSKGGAHSIYNVRVICKSCNSRKHTTMPAQLPLVAA